MKNQTKINFVRAGFQRPSIISRHTEGFQKFQEKAAKKYEVMLFDMKKYICSERLFNTLYIELKHKYEKTLQKNAIFFLSRAQLITVLLLIRNSYTGWSTGFMYLKVRVGFSILDSVLFLLKFIFLFNKKHGFFDFKTL